MEQINHLLNKINQFKKDHALDLSLEEDLSVAIMNLVSLEEHFFFSGAKTKKVEYFDLIDKTREIRKSLMKKIVKEGLIEVGTKLQHNDKKKEAGDLFKKAYDLYSLFWALNLKVIDPGQIKMLDENRLTKKSSQNDIMADLNNLVTELADCCKE